MLLPIIASVFIIFALLKVWLRFKDHTLSLLETFLWSILWLAVAAVFWQPEIASRLADYLGIGRGADLIVYIAIIVLAYVIFRLFVKVDKIDRQITKVVRELAIKNEKKGSDTDRQL